MNNFACGQCLQVFLEGLWLIPSGDPLAIRDQAAFWFLEFNRNQTLDSAALFTKGRPNLF